MNATHQHGQNNWGNQAHHLLITGNGASQLVHSGQKRDGNDKPYRPFFNEKTPRRYSRDRVVDVVHLKLNLTVEIEKKRLEGTASLTIVPIDEGVASLTLDACDMTIDSIACEGHPLTFSYDGTVIRIDFADPLPADQEVVLAIKYSVVEPRAGMYFVAPDAHYPNKPVEVWTQGQDEDSRYWFPCFDYPNERATTEMVVTVPERFNTLSNGHLVSKKTEGGWSTFHWLHETPHVAYLVTLVIGEFVEVKDEWDGIPVTYFHHPGDERRAHNSFADTPKMVAFFSEKIGLRYPYAKYSQIPVTDFIFGGMENTTATTQTAFTLHDDRAHLDFSSNPLVSHELAHQWFGNLITCRDWSHGWLNEGFTTYMECCWDQFENGDEHFQHYMLREMENYIDEDSKSYRRPVVCNRYEEPIELFDRHLYEKGACVQHLLRFVLGEKLFWKAIGHYTRQNAGRSVVTADWARAIEETTGRNVDALFDQWIYGGGYPAFKIGLSYDAKQRLATLTVTQTQKVDELTPVFTLPVKIAFTRAGHDDALPIHETRQIHIVEAEHRFHLPLDFEPDFVTFDVGNWILKTLDLSGIPEEALIRQLHFDTDVVARIHAARELAGRSTRRSVEALCKALGAEHPWFVLAEIAEALGKNGSETARDALIENMDIANPKARRGVMRALGEFKADEKVAEALIQRVRHGDESYFVEAEACSSLGKTRDKRALEVLKGALESRESYNEVIRVGAVDGMVALEETSALSLIKEQCEAGVPVRLRYQALAKLGELARLADERERQDIRLYLEKALEERDFFVSLGSIQGLLKLGEPESAAAMRRKGRVAVDGRIKARARKGADELAGKGKMPQQIQQLRDQIDDLVKKNTKLIERVEKLEAIHANTTE